MRSNGSVCLISIDGVDFWIQEPRPFSSRWFSHKINGPAVRYETGVCIQTGWIVWINGPFPCGDWPDLAIARHVLHHMLGTGEHCIADGGYRASTNCRAITPTGLHDYLDRQVAVVRARHETVDARLKVFGVLNQRFRHNLEKHGLVMHSVAVIVQIMISNGDTEVFSVEHHG